MSEASASPRPKRRLAAIMFSDIVGYSKLMGADESHAMKILAAHNRVVGAAIGEHGGVVIKQMGDGVLAEFGSAVDSVSCAVDIQKRVREHNGSADVNMRFEVRIGVHLGDVLVVGNDIIGDGVNVASRIEPMAPPGGVCISQDVYNQVHNKMELAAVSLGPQQFKNIERQIEIYKVLAEAVEQQGGGAVASTATRGTSTGWHKQRWVKVIGIALGTLLTLMVIGGIREASRKAIETRNVETAITDARTLFDAGEYDKARNRLVRVRDAVRPATPGLDKLADRLRHVDQKIAARDARRRIRQRYVEFATHLINRSMDDAIKVVARESIESLGSTGVRARLGVIGLMLAIGRVDDVEVRIHDIELDVDGEGAYVQAEAKVRGEWKKLNRDRWEKAGDEWFLIVK